MNHNNLSYKIAQVKEQIPKVVLYDFSFSYAQKHEELAMALVNEFWSSEKDDYRSMVQHIVHFSCKRKRTGLSEALFKVGMCLPAGPYVSDEDVKYIVETIRANIIG